MAVAAKDHGHAPDRSAVALIIVDVINDFDFPEAAEMADSALAMAHEIAALKQHAVSMHVPVIYANDNFGRWRSSVDEQVTHCLKQSPLARQVVEMLRPEPNDYFVLKPKHSAFFTTPLDTLLRYLGCDTLLLTGLTTDICVYFTANDAYMRDLKLIVPRDCVSAHTQQRSRTALGQLESILKADTRPWRELDLRSLAAISKE